MKKTFLVILILTFQTLLCAEEEAADTPPPPEIQTPTEEPVAVDAPAAPSETSPLPTSGNGVKLSKPLGRVKSLTNTNTESSSFIGDPDNIDPLNPNRENLKEDEEPVLEDIKQILDAPKKKITDVKPEGAEVSETPIEPSAKKPRKKAVKKVVKKAKVRLIFRPQARLLSPDDPDFKLEKLFNSIYRRYNINPTPADVWAAATSKQSLREYVVQKGDNLWSISKILFGDANFWPKIWAINKQGILNPHFIYPNSKIYFYMGNEESAPTLSVGNPSEETKLANNEVVPTGENAEGSPAEFAPEDTGAAGSVGAVAAAQGNGKKSKYDLPAKLPDSFPLSRNKKYFLGKKLPDIKVDLGEFPRFDYESVNDIYITDRIAAADVKINISEAAKFRCYRGRILRDIRYVGKLVEDYDVFERLNNVNTSAGTMYAYRFYGKANVYKGKYLKFSSCKGLLLTDLVIMAKEKMQTYRNKQISPSPRAVLIGGPEVVNQTIFAPNQVAYVDFGNYSFAPGQEFKVMSQVTDEINGNIKIIEKYGSFAVVLLTDVDDTIAIGDNVLLN